MTTLLAPLQTDPWATRLIDVARLNAHASSLLCRRLEDVRAAAGRGELLPTTSLALLGAAGAGKTHIFARLRRVVGGRASFVLVRPLLGAEPSLRWLLAETMDQLRRPSFGGTLSQLETLVGGALAARARFPSAGLAEAADMSRDERRARVDDALAALFALRPELEGVADYARRLLDLPFDRSENRTVLAAWLSGRDVEPDAARAAGLPGPLSDVDVLRALAVVAAFAAAGAPLLVAFDQLENLADASGDRVRAHGNLVAELVDQLPAVTLVQLALTGEWLQHIQPALSLPQRTRVSEQTVVLEEPSVEDRRALVGAWLDALPGDGRRGPFPSPLSAADVDRWCREPGMTPRLLLQTCRRALEDSGAPAPLTPPEPIDAESGSVADANVSPAEETAAAEATSPASRPPVPGRARPETRDRVLSRAWRAAVREARREVRSARGEDRLVDAERVAEVLEVTLGTEPESALVWRRTAGAAPYLVGTIVRGDVRGGVVVVQGHHPRSVASALERARDLVSEPILFVRQGSFDFPPSWRDVAARVKELEGQTRTCWLAISDDVLAHGLAFASVLAASRSGELTDPSGEPISQATLRAWSSTALGDSVEVLGAELRRVLGEWPASRAPASAVGASEPTALPTSRSASAPASASASTSGIFAELGALLDGIASRWGWSERPRRWLRAARERTRGEG